MGADTKIQWCDHTFNPWRGCSKVSAGCKHCYADAQAKRNPRTLGIWGESGTRVVASEAGWKEPEKWNHAAILAGERRRVFCASMADVFELWHGEVVNSQARPLYESLDSFSPTQEDDHHLSIGLDTVRQRLFQLIEDTPALDWLLLTKRPQNVVPMTPDHWVHGWPRNVWIGTSVENQATADERIPHLLKIPAAVRFLSCEPLLGSVRLDEMLVPFGSTQAVICPLSGEWVPAEKPPYAGLVDWVIVGGESGPNARPCDFAWIRSLIGQCQAAGVPCFTKQIGALCYDSSAAPICEFDSEDTWLAKARSWLGGISGGGQKYKAAEKSICIDAKGRWCQIGRDFMRATAEGTYPIRAYPQIKAVDPKGGDMDEWPADLRIRQFPAVEAAHDA